MFTSPIPISKEAVDQLYLQFGKDLKNLKLVELCIEKAIKIGSENTLIELTTELLLSVESTSLYEEKLETFFNSCTVKEKILLEKIFKQITLSQENSNQRRPIRIEKLLKVVGVEFDELRPFLQKFRTELDFILEIIVPNQKRLSTEEIVNRFKKIHGNRYDYSKVKYTGYNNNVNIICPTHGEFLQRVDVHLIGTGCPKCKLTLRFKE
jgi:hypothetical protein